MTHSLQRLTGDRRALVERLFPRGIPALWCPPLTHFHEDGTLDRGRMRAHLRFMRPHVGGFLVPGSTGEGWDLSDAEALELVDFLEPELRGAGAHLLVGARKPTAAEMVRTIEAMVAMLGRRTGARDPMEILSRSAVRGFAVCPPRGASISQREMADAVEQVLSLGVPIALYQLPSMTQNEIAPETVAALAARHPRLYLMKDSSGGDRVASSGLRELLFLRGAEGDYVAHLDSGGGRYDGFLLSTANCFPRPLAAIIRDVGAGRLREAETFSATLTALITALLDRARSFEHGNAYANANKALDHWLAHGPGAAGIPPPLIHGRHRLPQALVDAAGTALRRSGLLPERGYLGAE